MKIAVTSKAFCKNEILMRELGKYFDIKPNNHTKLLDTSETIELLHDCDGAIVALEKIDAKILKHCPKLQVISKYGVGLDNINLEDCKKFNVQVIYKEGINKTSVAEMTLGFMLMLIRNLYTTSIQLKNGNWNKNGGHSLYEKTIGIIGVGNIGKEVINLLQPFRCKILANDIIDQDEYYAQHNIIKSTKEEIFSSCDIITVHTPLTEETKFMINNQTLAMMQPTSFVINTARGGIVNLEDLKQALNLKQISGAAIDVYEQEPPTDTELLQIPNLICTPHIGGNSFEAVLAMGRGAINHLIKFAHGNY